MSANNSITEPPKYAEVPSPPPYVKMPFAPPPPADGKEGGESNSKPVGNGSFANNSFDGPPPKYEDSPQPPKYKDTLPPPPPVLEIPAPKVHKTFAIMLFGFPGAGCSTLSKALVEEQGMQLAEVSSAATKVEQAAEIVRLFHKDRSLSSKGVVIDVPVWNPAEFLYLNHAIEKQGQASLGGAVFVDDKGRGLKAALAAANESEHDAIRHRFKSYSANVADLKALFEKMGIFHTFDFPDFDADHDLKSSISSLRTILFQARLGQPKCAPFIEPELQNKNLVPVNSGVQFQGVMTALAGLLHVKKPTFPYNTPHTTMVSEAIRKFASSGTPQFRVTTGHDSTKCLLVGLGDRGLFAVPKSLSHAYFVNKTHVPFQGGAPYILLCSTGEDDAMVIEDCLAWEGADVTKKPYLQRVAPIRGAPSKNSRNARFEPFVPLNKLKKIPNDFSYTVEMIDADAPFSTAARLNFSPSPSFTLEAKREDDESVLHAFVHSANGAVLAPLPMNPNSLCEDEKHVEGVISCKLVTKQDDGSKQWRVIGDGKKFGGRTVAHGWPTLLKAGVDHAPMDLLRTMKDLKELISKTAPAVVDGPTEIVVSPPKKVKKHKAAESDVFIQRGPKEASTPVKSDGKSKHSDPNESSAKKKKGGDAKKKDSGKKDAAKDEKKTSDKGKKPANKKDDATEKKGDDEKKSRNKKRPSTKKDGEESKDGEGSFVVTAGDEVGDAKKKRARRRRPKKSEDDKKGEAPAAAAE